LVSPGTLVFNLLVKTVWAKKMVKQYNEVWDIIREISCINLELLRRKDFENLK